ncbi:polysaccharide deacetylase family protein [Cerasicoccus fimbriatus]|uniref:polysaccharide deacetylase family protein n=1 Tax=Cerasicoccus fimbriatus TaxID=3014554 RepID=UPI0022B33AC7|nr:polysaccharide deacetylase family protein [Cerasicoccus sp. TK19100]
MKLPLALVTFCAAGSLLAGEKQLLNLSGIPSKERMNVPVEYVWPENAGEAAVCLWKDDKAAAISYTIDDNCAMNIDWWLNEAAQREMKLTWFVVTGGISNSNPAMNGEWSQWQAVYDAGHSVESHTVTHLGGASKPEWKGIEWEYEDSKEAIDANIAGNTVTALAYPGGGNSSKNDAEVAKEIYIAARGTRGTTNGARGLDYMSINAMSRPNIGDNPKASFSDCSLLIDPESKAYRGWGVFIYHYIKGDNMDKTREQMDFYYNNRDDFWCASFSDAAKYAQSRDTSTLEVVENGNNRIVLNLTDWMKDDLYTYPLTVKVRLPDGWNGFRAKQGEGEELTTQVIEHEGAKYGLVDIVPDGGQTVLIPG